MRTPKMHQIDPTIAKIYGHRLRKSRGRVGETRNAFTAFKQAGKTLKFAIPIFLSTLDDHSASRIAHDDLFSAICRCPKHANGVIMGQNNMAVRLISYGAHFFDDLSWPNWPFMRGFL